MERITTFFLILIMILGCQQKELIKEAPLKTQPQHVQLITSDIELFWKMYDAELPLYIDEEVEEQYFNVGTTALSQFYNQKLQSPRTFLTLLNSWRYRQYYEDIRANTLAISEQKEEVKKALKAFQQLYPDAVFTDITLVMGALNTGGVLLRGGQIVVAAELFANTSKADTTFLSDWVQSVLHQPDYLPVVIIHELVHLQQRQYACKNNLPVGGRTLLDRALLEGSADFITKLVLGDFLSKNLLAYGDPIEKQLWDDFSKKMYCSNFGDWLYSSRSAKEQPADLGYYIGYKITEHYYKNTADKKQAIKSIIEMENGKSFLKASGYAQAFK